MTTSRGTRLRALALTVGVIAAGMATASSASAKPAQNGCDNRNNNTYEKILECVRVEGVREHQAAFQAIADANGGNRSAGTQGYTDSAQYVIDTMRAAGWTVTTDEFPFTYVPPAVLDQLTPVAGSYETGTFTGSGSGNVTANVVPVDINLTPPRASTSGCEAGDFAGFPAGSIALIQRGTCPFADKAINAATAGAAAVIIFNQGNANTADRLDLIIGTLGGNNVVSIPVVGASYADGAALAQAGSTAHVQVDPPESRPQINVIAELPGKNKNNVVMAGAHLDSVQRGPGINDNGSGSAVLLEVGQQLSNHKPENTLRFAWWGAEEAGLLGSQAYVDELDGLPGELDKIALYLNFDMVGSPNYVFMVYDGDETGYPAPVPVPEGSVQIEDVFESFYTWKGEPYDDAAFSGRSDYLDFILAGIPAGGLFTGAEVVKTAEQQALWGGTAGQQFDPCYHQPCDTFDNNSMKALDVNSDAVAFVVLTYAYSTESVNGVKGKKVPGNFVLPAPAGPRGTNAGGGFQEHPGN